MTVKCAYAETPGCAASTPPPGVYRWLKLVAGFILIWTLIFGIGSLAQQLPGAKRMAQVIDERGLRATAVYYTDFEEPAEGSERIRDSLDYMPRSDR
jgi:hypothetical protein